jgi:ABC-type polysaccharide/polyol phosphate export permease
MHQDPVFLVSSIGIGFAVWGFISTTLVDGAGSLTGAAAYIKQLNLPYSVYFMKNVAVASVVCLNGLVASILIRLCLGGQMYLGSLIALPGLVILGVAAFFANMALGYVGARFRDLAHGLSSVMNLLFVITPILYPPELLRARGGGFIVDFNPLFSFIEIIRRPLIYGQPASMELYTTALLVTLALFFIAELCRRYFGKLTVYYV